MSVTHVLHIKKTLTCSPVLTILFLQSHEETKKIKRACMGNILIKGYLRLLQ